MRRLLKKKGAVSPKTTPAHRDVQLRLQRALGTKVNLVDKGGKGSIVIDWHGYDGLEAILARLGV